MFNGIEKENIYTNSLSDIKEDSLQSYQTFEEIKKEKIHSSPSNGEKVSSQLFQEDSANSSEIEWLEEEDQESETIDFLVTYLNIIPVGLIFKYISGMFYTMKSIFQTKEETIKFIEKVKANPDEMEQKCEELELYTNTGPCWQRHVNFTQLFKMDYDSLTRICLINKEYVPNKKAFEDKHFKLTCDNITRKSHLSIKEIYMNVLNEEIEKNLRNFKSIKTISIETKEAESKKLLDINNLLRSISH